MEENPQSLFRGGGSAAASADMPADIITNILSRLPVKSLMRFRCACKPWLSLFTHPNFIHMHLNQTSANKNGLVFIQPHFVNTYEYDVTFHHDETFVEHSKVRIPFKRAYDYFTVAGYCHGLFCIYLDFRNILFLWNPAVRKFRVLPVSRMPCEGLCAISINFGFVPLVNDYKVLRLWYRAYGDDQFLVNGRLRFEVPPVVEIYSLSTNSWKLVENGVPYVVDFVPMHPFLNGVVHWVAHEDVEENGADECILSFDMADEVFGKIALPECCRSGSIKKFVTVLMESLALFVGFRDEPVQIWVMKEYGAPESWTKHFTFDRCVSISTPLGFMKNDEVVLLLENGDDLVFYDPIIRQVKLLRIYGVPILLRVVTHYMESLVLLNEGN